MKKILIILACLIAFTSTAFAQAGSSDAYVDPAEEFAREKALENDKFTTLNISVPSGFKSFWNRKTEDVLTSEYKYMAQESVDLGGSIRLEYFPLYDEVRVYYTCLMTNYDRGIAYNDVIQVLLDFLRVKEFETTDGDILTKPEFYSYKYKAGSDKFGYDTKEKSYRKGKAKYTEYYAYVKLIK